MTVRGHHLSLLAALLVCSLLASTSCDSCDPTNGEESADHDTMAETSASDVPGSDSDDDDDGDTQSEDSGEISDTSEPQDVVDTADVEEPDGWWTGHENRCVPPERAIEPEAWRAPALPADLGDVPRIAWEQRTFCPGLTDAAGESIYDGLNAATNPVGLGTMFIGGAERDVIVTSFTQPVASQSGNQLLAVATLDVQTGEPLACDFFPAGEGFVLRGEPIFDSGNQRFYVAATMVGDIGKPVVAAGGSPGGGVDLLLRFSTQLSISFYIALSHTAQLLLFADKRIASFDTISGEFYWSQRIDTLRAMDSPLGPLWFPFSGEDLLQADRCGQTSTVFGGQPGAYDPLVVGERIVIKHGTLASTDDVTVHRHDGTIVATLAMCNDIITVDDTRFACWRKRGLDEGEISVYDSVDGRLLSQMTIGVTGFLSQWLVAGAGGNFVTSSVVLNSGDVPDVLFVHFIASDGQLRSLRIVEPDDIHSTRQHERPVLSPSGMLILSAFSRLYGIQTDIGGLSRSAYPRGVLGGNENRGWVKVPTDAP